MSDPLTLYCLACAGSSAATYYPWRRLAPRWLRIEPVERPGRGARLREPHLRSYAQLVDLLTREISADLAPRYALLGHSLGALLAFGCARALRRSGAPAPSALIVAGAAAPSRRDMTRYATLCSDEEVTKELRRQGGTPEDVFAEPELLRMVLDAATADFAVCGDFRYFPEEPLSIPLLAFGGRDDTIEDAALRAWGEETTGQFRCDLMDGGHFFLREREEAFVTALVAGLEALSLASDDRISRERA
jgi:surfactin synthase thioesterase subunit